MADIVLAGNANWSTCNGGNPPAAGDTIFLEGFKLTLDGGNSATYTCAAIKARNNSGGAGNAGYIDPLTSTPFTMACDLYAGSATILTLASGKTITSAANWYGPTGAVTGFVVSGTVTTLTSATGGSGGMCIDIASSGVITTCTTATGGSATNAYGIRVRKTLTTLTNAIGGSAAGAHGVDVCLSSTLGTLTNATGGSAAGAYGCRVGDGGGGAVTNPIGTVKGGSVNFAYGLVVDSPLSTVTTVTVTAVDNSGVAPAIGQPYIIAPVHTWMGFGASGTVRRCIGTDDIVATGNVVTGSYTYSDGTNSVGAGTYPTTATTQAADAATVTSGKANVKAGTTFTFGASTSDAGIYPTTETTTASVTASVQAADMAVVNAGKAGMTTATRFTFGSSVTDYGTLDLSLYTLISGVVSASYVVTGYDNYTGGAHGSYPTSATSEATGAAAQLVIDKAALDANYIVTGHTFLTIAGLYPTTATSQAAQLVTDKAAVTSAKASIKDDTTILTIAGTYDFAAAIAAGKASGHSDQLATDIAEVDANKAYIQNGWTILTITGTLHSGSFDPTVHCYISEVVDKKYVLAPNANRVGGDTGTLTLPAEANVWYGSGTYGVVGALSTPAKRASSILNCVASNIKTAIVIDDVTGTYTFATGTNEYQETRRVERRKSLRQYYTVYAIAGSTTSSDIPKRGDILDAGTGITDARCFDVTIDDKSTPGFVIVTSQWQGFRAYA